MGLAFLSHCVRSVSIVLLRCERGWHSFPNLWKASVLISLSVNEVGILVPICEKHRYWFPSVWTRFAFLSQSVKIIGIVFLRCERSWHFPCVWMGFWSSCLPFVADYVRACVFADAFVRCKSVLLWQWRPADPGAWLTIVLLRRLVAELNALWSTFWTAW
jgi:hypothetical protein